MKLGVCNSSVVIPLFFNYGGSFYRKEYEAFLSSVFSPFEVFRVCSGNYFYRGYCIFHIGRSHWMVVKPGFPDFRYSYTTLADCIDHITYIDFGGKESE